MIDFLTDVTPLEQQESVSIADGRILYATTVGTLIVRMMDILEGSGIMCSFQYCLYIPNLSATLISVGVIDSVGNFVLFGDGKGKITVPNGQFVGQAIKRGNSYVLIAK